MKERERERERARECVTVCAVVCRLNHREGEAATKTKKKKKMKKYKKKKKRKRRILLMFRRAWLCSLASDYKLNLGRQVLPFKANSIFAHSLAANGDRKLRFSNLRGRNERDRFPISVDRRSFISAFFVLRGSGTTRSHYVRDGGRGTVPRACRTKSPRSIEFDRSIDDEDAHDEPSPEQLDRKR